MGSYETVWHENNVEHHECLSEFSLVYYIIKYYINYSMSFISNKFFFLANWIKTEWYYLRLLDTDYTIPFLFVFETNKDLPLIYIFH